jgi:AraC-like DNA-binding protein
MINTYDFKVAHPDIFKQLAVKDRLLVYYKCPQVETKINLYTHYNEIIFTLAGKRAIHRGERSWILTANKSLFVRKTAFNQERFYEAEWEVLAFFFQDDFLHDTFRAYKEYLPLGDLPPPPTEMLIEINVREASRAFFFSMLPFFSQGEPPSEGLLELKFRELLFTILSDPANALLLSFINSIADQQKIPVSQIMEGNYMFNLTVAEFARMAQRSPTAFKKDFHEQYQTTPAKWLSSKRLELAKHLLHASQKRVGEIAYECGFENLTHFSRVFKEKYNLSPVNYRKNIKHLVEE